MSWNEYKSNNINLPWNICLLYNSIPLFKLGNLLPMGQNSHLILFKRNECTCKVGNFVKMFCLRKQVQKAAPLTNKQTEKKYAKCSKAPNEENQVPELATSCFLMFTI